MVYAPTIYDWRGPCAPLSQVVRAGGAQESGGMTIGGALVGYPIPGGRISVTMDFATFSTVEENEAASWTISRIMAGALMRIPLYRTVQLVPEAALAGADDPGIPWDGGIPWATDANWSWNPTAPVAAAALRGGETFTADLGDLGRVLRIGHVIGFTSGNYDFTHVVMDIDYDVDDVATVTVSPTLRRALTTDDQMKFRPRIIATCGNAAEVMGNFQSGRHMTFGQARFVEALV